MFFSGMIVSISQIDLQAMENMFRSVSARLENYMLHYQESYQIEGDHPICMCLSSGLSPECCQGRYCLNRCLHLDSTSKYCCLANPYTHVVLCNIIN